MNSTGTIQLEEMSREYCNSMKLQMRDVLLKTQLGPRVSDDISKPAPPHGNVKR